MPVLKRKIIRNVDHTIIEDKDETKETKETVSIIPTQKLLICNKCGKVLLIRQDQPASVECSQCGCPDFHTSMEFGIECVNCSNKEEVKHTFCGYCKKCHNKIWKLI